MDELNKEVYVLQINELDENDAFIFVLDKEGNIIRLRALGFFKPESKNRQSISINCFAEVEFFQSHNFPNSGKLKRAVAIDLAKPKNMQQLNVLAFISTIIMQFKKVNFEAYKIIQNIVKNLEFNNYNFAHIILLINKIIQGENINLELTKCSQCGLNNKISGFSLKEGGLICSNCDERGQNLLKIDTIKKLMALQMANSIEDVSEIGFDNKEETIVKEMYKNFLNDNLGWNVSILNNI